jgi:hypothetical protein
VHVSTPWRTPPCGTRCPLNPPNCRMRTRTYGGAEGEAARPILSRFLVRKGGARPAIVHDNMQRSTPQNGLSVDAALRRTGACLNRSLRPLPPQPLVAARGTHV